MYRLEEKKAVRRVKKIGNAHIFEPLHLSLSSGNGAGAERRPRCGRRPVEGSAQVQPVGGRSGTNPGIAGQDRAVNPASLPPYALTAAGSSLRISETNAFASPKSISVLSM